ncbi:hypothetical protein TNCV_167061 [Trichonephila clavipes]|nr:hypothetical protein TNCV_167061 [Trichonephila clavipes]
MENLKTNSLSSPFASAPKRVLIFNPLFKPVKCRLFMEMGLERFNAGILPAIFVHLNEALECARLFSIILVYRTFRNRYGKEAPTDKSILQWYHQFKKTHCIKTKATNDQTSRKKQWEDKAEFCSKSMKGLRELPPMNLECPRKGYRKFYKKKLNFKPYHLQFTQQITEVDKIRRFDFCFCMQEELGSEDFVNTLIFLMKQPYICHDM